MRQIAMIEGGEETWGLAASAGGAWHDSLNSKADVTFDYLLRIPPGDDLNAVGRE